MYLVKVRGWNSVSALLTPFKIGDVRYQTRWLCFVNDLFNRLIFFILPKLS